MATVTYTHNNTEGYTDEDLDVLNAAQGILEVEFPGVDPTNIADLLHNEFTDGVSEADLIARVKARLD